MVAHPKRGQRPVGRVIDLFQKLWAVTSGLLLALVAVAVSSLVLGLVGSGSVESVPPWCATSDVTPQPPTSPFLQSSPAAEKSNLSQRSVQPPTGQRLCFSS